MPAIERRSRPSRPARKVLQTLANAQNITERPSVDRLSGDHGELGVLLPVKPVKKSNYLGPPRTCRMPAMMRLRSGKTWSSSTGL